ncbi:uncharacterized protein LOC108736480 [Agrilus planipennis]|uniref:Uncharacterized protein LOC108736480 n=1 Tax=Agrilus planipennis TaxID=224129 RepID=A0A1W4WWB4_AGRPL|nr:uncharacterized protein LOC108736480 [Agrilus planipennis]
MQAIKFFPLLFCVVCAAPSVRIYPEQSPPQLMTLPSNATIIRTDITDSFSCEGREYGYYADVDNDCQIFHVCLPVNYGDGRSQMFRWSFICPEETVFSQEIFTCISRDDMVIDCMESPKFYILNRNIGVEKEHTREEDSSSPMPQNHSSIDDVPAVPEVPQSLEKKNLRKAYENKRKVIE